MALIPSLISARLTHILEGAFAGPIQVDDQLVDGRLPRGSRLGHNRPADIANARGQGLKDGRSFVSNLPL